jgi:tetratricopeptide (TPR) repeat protein
MSTEEEDKSRLVKRYTRLAIISAFLLALFWPLGSFFFWIFMGAATYFAFLAFYYRPRVMAEDTEDHFEFTRPRGYQERPPDQPNSIHISPKNVKLIIALVIGSFFSFMMILMIIGFVTSDDIPSVSEDASINESRDLLLTDPNNLEALTNLGNDFYAKGQYDSAIVYYDRVLSIDPKNSSGLYNKGLSLYSKKDYQNSMESLRQCISLYPDNTDAIMIMGDNYYSQEQFTQAMTWYKQAYEKGARTSGLFNVMGYIYDQQNQKSEAIRLYKETLQQDSSLVDVYNRLAELEPNRAEWYKMKAEAWK